MADALVDRVISATASAFSAAPAEPADAVTTPDATRPTTLPAEPGRAETSGTKTSSTKTSSTETSSTGADRTEHAEDESAASLVPPGVNLDIQLVMTDRTLFDGAATPAVITGYGPIPAPLARRLVREAGPGVTTWVRRLYTNPETGQLATADARRRLFPIAVRQLLVTRDQTCRTPWCGAPIRHADHVVPFADGGPTTAANGQGLCEDCNHTKQAAGWSHLPGPFGAIITSTPSGHTYWSDPPPPPRSKPWFIPEPSSTSLIEQRLHALLAG